MRVATVHTKALLPNKRVSVNIIEPAISVTDSVTARVARSDTGKESFSQVVKILKTSIKSDIKNVLPSLKCLSKKSDICKAETNISRFFKERPDEDLIELCEKYLNKLSLLVDECEKLLANNIF